MRKGKKVIKIQEDVKVPGTDVILEAGDRIEVLTEAQQYSIESLAEALNGRSLDIMIFRDDENQNTDYAQIIIDKADVTAPNGNLLIRDTRNVKNRVVVNKKTVYGISGSENFDFTIDSKAFMVRIMA